MRQVSLQNYVFLDAYADAGETEALLLYKQLAADNPADKLPSWAHDTRIPAGIMKP